MKACGLIVDLNSDISARIGEVGPKAFHLYRLKKMGFNVPDGWCVLSQAYLNHLDECGCISILKNRLTESITAEREKELLEQIRRQIIEFQVNPELINKLKQLFEPYKDAPIAVRSSATIEDGPGQSFAGQFETFLGVRGPEQCVEAIQKCWASCWSHRAFHYRRIHSINHFSGAMAVIIQPLIPAESSGVAFTQNPVTGDANQIVIESCYGLGEGLVSGKISPDRFVVDKKSLAVISKTIANKALKIIAGSSSRTREEQVEQNQAEQSSLSEAVIIKLAESAKKIEDQFNCPQDIEWAVVGDTIYYLQSRPVTAQAKQKNWADRQVWTNMNTGEIMPDVMTPISWSFLEYMIEPLFGSLCRFLAIELGNHPLAGLVAGRVYFNINTGLAAVSHLPKTRNNLAFFEALLGGQKDNPFTHKQIRLSDLSLPDLKGRKWKFWIRLPETLYQIFQHHRQSRGKRFLAMVNKKLDSLYTRDYSGLSNPDLAQNLVDSIDAILEGWDLLYIVHGFLSYPALGYLCKKWLHDSDGIILNTLIRGREGMEDVQAGLDLWGLAAFIKEHPSLQTPLVSAADWKDFRGRIDSAKEGRDFLQKYSDFIQKHGHLCRGEMELYNPRWSENHDYVFGIIRNYYSGINNFDFARQYQDNIQRRDELFRQVCGNLNPIKKGIISYLIKQNLTGAMLRENFKNTAVRYIAWLRKWLLVLGRRLNEADILEEQDDIFFLKFDELHSAARQVNISELRRIIKIRRQEYQFNLTLTPPGVVVGEFNPDAYIPRRRDENIQTFKGLSVYPGIVTGPARVVLKADDKQHVQPGEILVAPFTDPGWTPYFITAAGVVVDQGGLLSHGSIIARELGIPTVVNVGPASRIICTGQKILLNANTGTVTVLESSESG